VSGHTEIWMVRHGETEWSLSGAHTSYTDIPLTERGRERAVPLKAFLAKQQFSLVLSSPRQRARQTAEIAGFGDRLQVEENLAEWNYGIFEGKTTPEIRKEHPGWSVWTSPIEGGESLEQVGARAKAVLDRARAAGQGSKVLLFSHAHMLRILAGVWLGLGPQAGQLFALGTGSVSVLGYERETPVIRVWNRGFDED
jgi:broad specificity phosphatase PhoE